jgi:hypothetical protein
VKQLLVVGIVFVVGTAVGIVCRGPAPAPGHEDPVEVHVTNVNPADGVVRTTKMEPLFAYDEADPEQKRIVARAADDRGRWIVKLVYRRGTTVVHAASDR